jgi:hypothetical protein
MTTPNEPTKSRRGACPNCGSKNLRRIRAGDNEAVIGVVIVRRRACRDCGTVFSPAVSPLLVLVTVPPMLACFAFAVRGAFFNERLDQPTTNMVAWWVGLMGLLLVGATVQILRQREPKIHESPRGPREPKPWD